MKSKNVIIFNVKESNMAVIFQKAGDKDKRLPETHVKTLFRKKDGAFEINDSRNFATALVGFQLLSIGRGIYKDDSYTPIINMRENTIYRFVHRGKSISFYLEEVDRAKDHFEIVNTEPVSAEYADITIPQESVEEIENIFNNREKQ